MVREPKKKIKKIKKIKKNKVIGLALDHEKEQFKAPQRSQKLWNDYPLVASQITIKYRRRS